MNCKQSSLLYKLVVPGRARECSSQHLIDEWSLSHFAWGAMARRFGKLDHSTSLILHELFELVENDPRFIRWYNTINTFESERYNGDSIINTLGDLASFHLGYKYSQYMELAMIAFGYWFLTTLPK
jgi:hypothetical protein